MWCLLQGEITLQCVSRIWWVNCEFVIYVEIDTFINPFAMSNTQVCVFNHNVQWNIFSRFFNSYSTGTSELLEMFALYKVIKK